MQHQTIIEWSSLAACFVRGLGEAIILQNTLGSYSCNPQFLVMLQDGRLRTVDQNDICLYGNPSATTADGSRQVLESETIKKWKNE